jgi:hypothetical protein
MNDPNNLTAQSEREKGTYFEKHGGITVLCLGLLGIFVLPWLFTRPWFADFTDSGQIGDTIGGTTAPFIGLLSAWLVYRAFKAQIKANELISEQLKIEEQRYKDEKIKDIEEAQATNFMKMYEAYVHTLNMCSRVTEKTNTPFKIKGRQFIEEITEEEPIRSLCRKKYGEQLVIWFDDLRHIKEVDVGNPGYKSYRRIVANYVERIDGWSQLMPTFRMTFHLLKRELAQGGLQKYDNIRFFRAQLTEPELIALAINVLFNDEGRAGLAVVAAKSGLFKHLKTENLKILIKQEFRDTQAGFFDIKITERELKEQPFIFEKT